MALADLQPLLHDLSAPSETPVPDHSLRIRVGSRFTRAVRAARDRPIASRILSHGPVLLAAAQAEAASATGTAAARVVRAAARQVAERAGLESLNGVTCPVLGAGGIARAVITLGGAGRARASLAELRGATETLALTWVGGQRGGPSHKWVEPMLIGAAILEATLEFLGVEEIAAEELSSLPLAG